ncbi:S8 family serine peptidase [Roseateles sp. GG27B]
MASGLVMADAYLDPALVRKLATAQANEAMPVIVSYAQSGPVTQAQIDFARSLGIQRGVYMRALPIMGVVTTPALIKQLAKRSDVVSIYQNAPLKLLNYEARQETGIARVYDNPADFGRAIPYSGRGVTVMINDSGIDTNNPDLPLGTKVVDNVQAAQNIALSLAADLAGPGILPIAYVRNQINTDLGSGHGTHCAGIVGGTGVSSGGKLRGAAPGADLLGYGSGGVLLILDAVGGLDYALTNQFTYRFPIRVTSNSWGTSGKFEPLNPVNIASYELYKKGIISVFAAGNAGPGEDTHNPYAQAPWVVSVGASQKNGVLTNFSSRGNRGETDSFKMPDGVSWTHINEPTIVAPGVDIVSTRAVTGTLPLLAAQADATLPPGYIPFYTTMSGTSMATPHVAGVVANMLEANGNLTPMQVKNILKATATNMTGHDAWEVGAGHVNAYAAVAMSQGLQSGYGKIVKSAPERSYFASQLLTPPTAAQVFNINFAPVGTVNSGSFTVGASAVSVSARATTGTNTVAAVLIDPNGKKYVSSITLPVLGETATITAPAVVGTWQVTMRGYISVAGATNGFGVPETIPVSVTQLLSNGYSGLSDIGNHPARTAIQSAVAARLVDGYSNGTFGPDAALSRSELAQYLVLAGSLRQSLPFPGKASASGVDAASLLYPFAEAVTTGGAVLRDLSYSQAPVLPLQGGAFNATAMVSRLDLAYAFVQSLAMQPQAVALAGSSLTVLYNGSRVPVEDSASVPAAMRGYVQLALDTGTMFARFGLKPSTVYGGAPTVVAYFDAANAVSRADYAFSAGMFATVYRSVEK